MQKNPRGAGPKGPEPHIRQSSAQPFPSAPPAETAGRRAFLKKSAAAVPVILTLRSGAALAASSITACADRDADRATAFPPRIDPVKDADIWMRFPKGNEGPKESVDSSYTGELAYFRVYDTGDVEPFRASSAPSDTSPLTGSCYGSIASNVRIGG